MRLTPDRLRQLPERRIRRPQLAAEVLEARIEEVGGVVLAPLVVVEALDPAAELPSQPVGVRDRLGLPLGIRLEGELAALQAERVDAAGLGHPDLALLGDALEDEGGAGRAAVVGVAVVVDAPQRR